MVQLSSHGTKWNCRGWHYSSRPMPQTGALASGLDFMGFDTSLLACCSSSYPFRFHLNFGALLNSPYEILKLWRGWC